MTKSSFKKLRLFTRRPTSFGALFNELNWWKCQKIHKVIITDRRRTIDEVVELTRVLWSICQRITKWEILQQNMCLVCWLTFKNCWKTSQPPPPQFTSGLKPCDFFLFSQMKKSWKGSNFSMWKWGRSKENKTTEAL